MASGKKADARDPSDFRDPADVGKLEPGLDGPYRRARERHFSASQRWVTSFRNLRGAAVSVKSPTPATQRGKQTQPRTHPEFDAIPIEEHGQMRQPARPDRIDTWVDRVGRDPSEGQDQVLFPKRRQRQQRFQVPTDGPPFALMGTRMGNLAVLDRARVEEERRARVGNLEPRPLRQLFDQPQEGHLVRLQTGFVIVGSDAVDPDGAAREQREDESVSEAGVAFEREHARRVAGSTRSGFGHVSFGSLA